MWCGRAGDFCPPVLLLFLFTRNSSQDTLDTFGKFENPRKRKQILGLVQLL
jgi:hypothetical protein